MYVLPYGQMSLWGKNLSLSCSSLTPPISYGLGELKPNKKFMSMFVGLVDGDGYIEIGPQKQYNKSTEFIYSRINLQNFLPKVQLELV